MCFSRLKKIQEKKKKAKARAELEAEERRAAREAEEGRGREGKYWVCGFRGLYALIFLQLPRPYLMLKKMMIYCLNDQLLSSS